MKVPCNIYRKGFGHKPEGAEIGEIQNNLDIPECVEIQTIADVLVHGGNIRITACTGRGDEDFKSGQLVGIDCDNSITIRNNGKSTKVIAPTILSPEDVRNILVSNGIYPSFQYKTWSDTKEWPRFRTVFVLDRPVSDSAEYMAILQYTVSLFSEYHADRGAATLSRVFFGSQAGETCFSDFEAVTNADAILSKCDVEKWREQLDKSKSKTSVNNKERRKTRKTSGKKGETANLRVIEAIQNHNTEYLKRRIGNKRILFDNQKELYDYIYRLPLDELLGTEKGTPFCCILPGHEDTNPSASVFQTPYGVWKYKCFANCLNQTNGTALNIKQLIELIGDFKSEFKAIEFICAIYNLKIKKTAWSEEQLANIDRILNCITAADGEDAFSMICPTAAKVTRNAMLTYIQILQQAKNTIYPEKTGDGNVIFYLSTRRLAAAAGKKSPAQVQGYIKQLCYCHMLEILDDKDIPKPMLQKAIEAQKEGQKRTAFYCIPSFVLERTILIEEYGIKWKANGYRTKGISYEMFFRTEPEEAARLYPESRTRICRD